jgi:hypothetical protein
LLKCRQIKKRITMTSDDRDLHVRIHAEYQEMPGLKLTLAQASRLFNLEPTRCAQALNALVDGGLLRAEGQAFLHARGGRQYV